MRVSVYQSGRSYHTLSLDDVMAACKTENAVAMVELCCELVEFGLLSLNGVQSIIKPADPGDEKFTFAALLDRCIGPEDVERHRQDVFQAALTKAIYPATPQTVRLQIKPDGLVTFDLVARIRGTFEVEEKIKDLMQNDPQFREQLRDLIMQQMIRGDVPLAIGLVRPTESEILAPAELPDGQDWAVHPA